MKITTTAWVALAALCGCATAHHDTGAAARADLKDKDGKIVATALLREGPRGVTVSLEATGLTPGLHAVHIHAVGRCDGPAFTSAAGHFNPLQKQHGHKNRDGAHAGDLPNMLAAKDGSGRFEVLTDAFTLASGPTSLFDVDGSAIIIHAAADDYLSDPAGNAGDRVACGVITASR